MYNTSNAYKEAINKKVLKSRVSGKITFSDKSTVDIQDHEIVPGSLSVNNKCGNGSNFCFGSVYVGELNVTIIKDIDRYSLYGAKVEFTYYLMLTDGSWEAVSLGIFFVDEPKRTKKLIALKCYDSMTAFDVDITEETVGTPYQLLTFICEYCGVELANTEEDIMVMCNGTQLLSIYADRMGTYRDAIHCIASVLAGFATIDRAGKLCIRSFATAPCISIPARKRTASTIADYETYFYGARARFVANQNYYPYEEIDETIEGGLLLDLGDIPVVQGLEETKHEILANILNVLKEIRYTPSDISMVGDPSLDLGDMLSIMDANSTADSLNTLVTSVTWKYHAAMKIKSDGGNTKLQGVSSHEDKQLSNMELSIETKNVVAHTFANSSKISIDNAGEATLIVINYATVDEAKPVFIATIPLEMTLDGYIEFYIYIDGIIDENGVLSKYLERGKHFVTLSRYFVNKANERHTVTVTARTAYVESDNRKNQADTATILNFISASQADREEEKTIDMATGTFALTPVVYDIVPVDTTPPKATIIKNDIKAVLYAQGLAGTSKWDGTITIDEFFAKFGFDDIQIVPFNGVVSIESKVPQANIFAEVIAPITFEAIQIKGFKESVGVNEIVVNYTFETGKKNVYEYNNKYVKADDKFMLNTDYVYQSVEQTIDSGKMCVVSIDTLQFNSVDSIILGVV